MKREKKKRKYNYYCLGLWGMVWGGGGGLYKGIKWELWSCLWGCLGVFMGVV